MTTRATGQASEGQVGTQQEGHRATATRPHRLVGRDCEIVEVIERIALTPLTTLRDARGRAHPAAREVTG
jgi:hypothetical protein